MADERPPLASFIQRQDLEPEASSEAVLKKLRGPKGEKPSKEDLLELIIPLIPLPQKGDNGYTPVKGKDYFDGTSVDISELLPIIKNLIPEPISPSLEELEAIILPLIPETQEAPELAPKELIEKINKAKTAKIKRERVEGFDELEGLAKSANRNVQNFISLGGNRQTKLQLNGVQVATGADTINFVGGTLVPKGDGTTVSYTPPSSTGGQVNSVVAGSGISVNNTDPANPVVSATGTTVTFFADTVSGTINSSNTVFTVPNTITTALALWLANSIYQPGVDFTVTGAKQITMTVAPDSSLSGQPFWLSHI